MLASAPPMAEPPNPSIGSLSPNARVALPLPVV